MHLRLGFVLLAGLIGFLGQSVAVHASGDAIGGGWLGGGVLGEYYPNASLTGTPAFVRRDVRVDFNWGAYGTPGGSRSPAFAAVGHTNFSIKWTGQIMTRFNESYTFLVVANAGARLYLWPTNGAPGQLLNAWSSPGTNTVTMPLVAGQVYNLELDYNFGMVGTPVCRLLWSSPSTPQEVLDTATLAGLNVDTYGAYVYQLYANAMDDSRDEWGNYNSNVILPPTLRDTNGWPTTDATNIVFEGAGEFGGSIMTGTYLLQFQGRAAVNVNTFGGSAFMVNGTNYGNNLPFGTGYNSASNLTTAAIVVSTNNSGLLYLGFQNTRRNPGDTTNSGVTNVKLMRPVTPGSTNSFPVGTYFCTNFESVVQRYTLLRWIHNNQAVPDTEWGTRTSSELPSYSTHNMQGTLRYWEYMVMLANESGKDLYVSFPAQASNAYLTNLANLICYGSDGVNPYTSPQASPVYPPLNANLRVILEHYNEVWNYAFLNWGQNWTDMLKAYTNNTPDWRIVDYDDIYNPGSNSGYGMAAAMRWHVLRAVRCSEIFRGVFGDAAMGSRVRVIYEYQYDDINGTASLALPFVDNYFNNADGTNHVATPHPVNYYLWGAGGAVYFGSGDAGGTNSGVPFAAGSFESPALASGQTQTNPANSGWTFTGTAGIYNGAVTAIGAPPAPVDGSQAAFIQGTGAISQTITFTNPGTYALSFLCAVPSSNANSVQFYYDSNLITPNGNYAYGAFSNQWVPGSFGVSGLAFNNYSSYVFQVTNSGQHTITVRGLGIGQYDALNKAPNSNLFIYFDQFQIVSATALFSGGIPGTGQANGQAGSSDYIAQLNSQARYAQAYGLQVVAYEGGWSLGGDFGATAFQNWCKFYDPRAATANLSSLNIFAQSGSRYYTFGTYETWPGYDTVNAAVYPLVQALDTFNAVLPPTAINGLHVPAVLTPANNKWYQNANPGTGGISGAGGWFYWNVLVPASGNYVITPGCQSGAGAILEADGTVISPGTAVTNFLAAGLHALKLRSTNGAFAVTNLTVSQTAGPGAPVLIAANEGNGSFNLLWTSGAGGPAAQGYLVYCGTAPRVYGVPLVVGNVTNFTIPNLVNGVTYYVSVVATNAVGYSLISNELNVTPVAPGQLRNLLAWDFLAAGGHAASDGNVASVSSTTTAYGMQPGTLSRGSGSPTASLQSYAGYGAMNMNSQNSWTDTNLTKAVSDGSYFQFDVTPVSGKRFSIASVAYTVYQQGVHATATVVLEFSTNGFASGGVALNTNNAISSYWAGTTNTVALSGVLDLQNKTNTITFRLYGYGFSAYEDKGLGEALGNNLDLAVVGTLGSVSSTNRLAVQSVSQAGGMISQLGWSGDGLLLEAPAVTGPWVTNFAATAPYAVMPTNSQRFYRLLNP